METLQNKGIKEIIDEFPPVGEILDSYEIGCVPCSLGTCKLKDVVDIHNLEPEVELDMMKRIAEVVFPGQEVKIPLRERKSASQDAGLQYSPPMRILVEEHVVIKRLLAVVPHMLDKVNLEQEAHRFAVLEAVDFVRNYADRYHHAKEEDVLFGYFDENIDIIQVMLADHVAGRNHMKGVVAAVEALDAAGVARHLTGYAELLTQHIKKEDEILYPWMDRELSDSQVGLMYARFNEINAAAGGLPDEYRALVERLESAYTPVA